MLHRILNVGTLPLVFKQMVAKSRFIFLYVAIVYAIAEQGECDSALCDQRKLNYFLQLQT